MSYFRELEGLRGLMAMWVVVGHWSTTVNIPNAIGRTKLFNGTAVDVFIILSGFAITAMLMRQQGSFRGYITRRAFRIFPVYLLFLVASAIIATFALQTWQMVDGVGYMNHTRIIIAERTIDQFWMHLLAHLPAAHGLVPAGVLPSSDYAILGQAWSISLEWQFYLVAPILIAPLLHPSRSTLIAAGAVLLAMGAVSLANGLRMPEGYLGGNLHLAKFYLGIGSAYCLITPRTRQFLLTDRTVSLLLAGTGMAAVLTLMKPQALCLVIWFGTMFVIISAQLGSTGTAHRISNLLLSQPVQRLGRMSYSIYLSHMLIMIFAIRALMPILEPHGAAFTVILLAMTVPVTLVVSSLSYRFIEAPFQRYGRRYETSQREGRLHPATR